MAQDEKIFADGFSFKRNEKAPEFVVGRLSLKVDDAVAFLKEHQRNGWVNLNVKTARSGNHYVELDTYEAPTGAKTTEVQAKPKPKAVAPAPVPEPDDDELPF